MEIGSIAVALVTGVLGSRVAALLLPRAALAGALSLVAGAAGGAIASALFATVVAAARAVPLPSTTRPVGLDLATILGNAAGGALGGIVIVLLAGALMSAMRVR